MNKVQREAREEARRRESERQRRVFNLRPWDPVPIDTQGCRNPEKKGSEAWLAWEKAAALQRAIDQRRARRAAAQKMKPEMK